MKKICLLVALTVCSIYNISAQFTLTKDGFVNSDRPSENYVVFEVPGKSQAELFTAVKNHLTLFYAYPEIYLRTVDPEGISVNYTHELISHNGGENGVTSKIFDSKSLIVFKTYLVVNYSVTFQFKDGKIMVNGPLLSNMYHSSSSLFVYNTHFNYGSIFANNGTLKSKHKNFKEYLENYFNNYVNNVIKSAKGQNAW